MKLIIKLFFIASFFLPAMVFAQHEGHMMTAPASQTVSLEGRIVGMTCLMRHNSQGEMHKDCARMCAEKGLPLAVLTSDDQLYQIIGEGHEDLKTVNAKYLDFIEEPVVVKGFVFKAHGNQMIVISDIQKK